VLSFGKKSVNYFAALVRQFFIEYQILAPLATIGYIYGNIKVFSHYLEFFYEIL